MENCQKVEKVKRDHETRHAKVRIMHSPPTPTHGTGLSWGRYVACTHTCSQA